MSRTLNSSTSLFLGVLVLAGAAASPARAGVIADKGLEEAIKKTLQDVKGELKEADLNNLYVLDATNRKIKSLAGLEKAKNLLELRLAKNEIVDVKPLKELVSLQSLDLEGNKIEDVAPLAPLV